MHRLVIVMWALLKDSSKLQFWKDSTNNSISLNSNNRNSIREKSCIRRKMKWRKKISILKGFRKINSNSNRWLASRWYRETIRVMGVEEVLKTMPLERESTHSLITKVEVNYSKYRNHHPKWGTVMWVNLSPNFPKYPVWVAPNSWIITSQDPPILNCNNIDTFI